MKPITDDTICQIYNNLTDFGYVVVGGVWAAIRDAPDYVIGLVALWAAVGVLLLIRLIAWLLSRRKARNIPSGLGIAHPHRRSFPEFLQKLKDSSEVWAYWHTGGNFANNPNSFNEARTLRMLILIAPTNSELDQLSAITDVPTAILQNQIRQTTELAQKAGCSVRWWYGHITDNTTVGNPNGQNTWCEIETLMPRVDAKSRPRMEFKRDDAPVTCDGLQKWFNDMWLNQELCRESTASQ